MVGCLNKIVIIQMLNNNMQEDFPYMKKQVSIISDIYHRSKKVS